MKRNDICYRKDDIMYGRINRKIDADHFEVIDCGRFVSILHRDDIVLINDYNGYWSNRGSKPPVFIRMSSLRKLKQRAARYDKTVWKKYRK